MLALTPPEWVSSLGSEIAIRLGSAFSISLIALTVNSR